MEQDDSNLMSTHHVLPRIVAMMGAVEAIYTTRPERNANAQPILVQFFELVTKVYKVGGVTSGQIKAMESHVSKARKLLQ